MQYWQVHRVLQISIVVRRQISYKPIQTRQISSHKGNRKCFGNRVVDKWDKLHNFVVTDNTLHSVKIWLCTYTNEINGCKV